MDLKQEKAALLQEKGSNAIQGQEKVGEEELGRRWKISGKEDLKIP